MKVRLHLPTATTREAPATFRGVPVDRLRKAPAAPIPEPVPAPQAPPPSAPTPAAAAPAAPAPTPAAAPPRGPLAEGRALPWDRPFFFCWCPAEQAPKRRHATREGALAEADRLHGLFPDKDFLVFEALPVATGEQTP